MNISSSIALIAIGAILTFAVTFDIAGINIDVVGIILMLVGVVWLILGLTIWSPKRRTTTRERPPR